MTVQAPLPENGDDPVVRKLWPSTGRSVGRARHELADTLDTWGLAKLTDAAVVVLSELMTNALVHSRVRGRGVETWYVRTDDGVRLEVHDAGDRQPALGTFTPDAENGRGLALVAALAGPGRWGVRRREGPGKLVWAELTASPADDF